MMKRMGVRSCVCLQEVRGRILSGSVVHPLESPVDGLVFGRTVLSRLESARVRFVATLLENQRESPHLLPVSS